MIFAVVSNKHVPLRLENMICRLGHLCTTSMLHFCCMHVCYKKLLLRFGYFDQLFSPTPDLSCAAIHLYCDSDFSSSVPTQGFFQKRVLSQLCKSLCHQISIPPDFVQIHGNDQGLHLEVYNPCSVWTEQVIRL